MFCPNFKILCYISVLNKNNFTAFFLKTTFIKVNKKLQSTAGNFEVALGCSFILKIEVASHQRQRFRTQWLTTMEVTSRTLGESPLLSVGVLVFFVFLGVPAAVDDVPSRRGDVDGVQDGPQDLAERSADAALKGYVRKTLTSRPGFKI